LNKAYHTTAETSRQNASRSTVQNFVRREMAEARQGEEGRGKGRDGRDKLCHYYVHRQRSACPVPNAGSRELLCKKK
jgi:hypothetical protein